MLASFRRNLKTNALFWLNILVLILLVYGLVQTFGGTYLPEMGIYTAAFAATYFLLNRRVASRKWELKEHAIDRKWIIRSMDALILLVIVFQVVHYVLIGNVPVIKAMFSTDYYYIAQIRQDIKKVDSTLVNYGSSFLIKAVLPVMLFIFWYHDRRRFWILLPVSIFYVLALMQKAFIVTILIPLIMALLLERRWIVAGIFSGVFMAGIVLLVLVTNPTLRPAPFDCGECESALPVADTTIAVVEEPASASKADESSGIAGELYNRVFIMTGEMVGNWFHYIPDSLPYLYGDGYRMVAKMRGHEFHEYSYDIYKYVRPKEAKMGFDGTATSAHFMYDYANFGMWGLVLSGAILAAFLVLVNMLFGTDFRALIALNTLFILWLSSAQFSTTLLSGGWLLTLLLYWFYKPILSTDKQKALAEKDPR